MGMILDLYNRLTGYDEREAILKRWQELNPNVRYDERLDCFTDWGDEKLSKIPTNREIVLHNDGVDVLCRLKSKNLVGDDVLVEVIKVLD